MVPIMGKTGVDKSLSMDAKKKVIEVMTYSGYKANERPTHFFVDQDKRSVEEVLDRWYGPDEDYFKVTADDGLIYLLKWSRARDVWFLEHVWDDKTALSV